PVCQRDDDELSRDEERIAEPRDSPRFRLAPVCAPIGRDRLAQMIFDLLSDAARERAVEAERGGELVEIVGNHVGFLRGPAPARRLPIAAENCRQTLLCSDRARCPRWVNV